MSDDQYTVTWNLKDDTDPSILYSTHTMQFILSLTYNGSEIIYFVHSLTYSQLCESSTIEAKSYVPYVWRIYLDESNTNYLRARDIAQYVTDTYS